jgi:hypothetical protein
VWFQVLPIARTQKQSLAGNILFFDRGGQQCGEGDRVPGNERLGGHLQVFCIAIETAVHKLVYNLVMHRQESLQLAR